MSTQLFAVSLVLGSAVCGASAAPAPPPKPAGKGFLGVNVRMAAAVNPNLPGVYVLSVVEEGPGDQAGIREGDVILRVDGVALESLQQFLEVLAKRRPGDKVTLDVVRRGQENKFKVTLGARPKEADPPPAPAKQDKRP
jgi:S1-C subfamily serine protease